MIKKIHLLLIAILILSNQSTFSQNNLSKKEILDSIIQVLYHSERWFSENPLENNPEYISLYSDFNFSINNSDLLLSKKASSNYGGDSYKIINPNFERRFIYGGFSREYNGYFKKYFEIDYNEFKITYPSQNGYGLYKAGRDDNQMKLFFKNVKSVKIYIDDKLKTQVYLKNDFSEFKLFTFCYSSPVSNGDFSYSDLMVSFDKHENAIKFYKLVKLLKDL